MVRRGDEWDELAVALEIDQPNVAMLLILSQGRSRIVVRDETTVG